MYLRSAILSLIIVINMSAVNYELLRWGTTELAVGAPLIGWLAKKCYQTSRASSDQMWEGQQELQKMGAEIKYNPVIAIPSWVKCPENCSPENKQKIDKIFDDLKFVYATRFVCDVSKYFLIAASLAVGLHGAIEMLESLIDACG